MSLTKRSLGWLGIALTVAALSGCPRQLYVEPLSKSFGEVSTTDSIRIYNVGNGMLQWQVTENLSWLKLSVDGGVTLADALAGATENEVDVVGLYLDRSLLPFGTTTGDVLITSDGGSETVRVSATKKPSALLQVSDVSLDFGVMETQQTMTVTNGGVTSLDWSLTVSTEAPWLTATPLSASLTTLGNESTITVSVNRTGLAAGDYTGQLNITSNGGNATVAVRMTVPPFSASPDTLAFGSLLGPATQEITLRNSRFDPLPVTVTLSMNGSQNWLSVAQTNPTIPVGTPLGITVTADPAGLTPGAYAGEIQVTESGTGYTRSISVSMTVPGLSVTPSQINFGPIGAAATDSIQLGNLGTQPITWNISVPASAARWLSVNPASGTLQTQPVTITVSATPTAVDPGQYSGVLSITSDGGDRTVTVKMERLKPAALTVVPETVEFGASSTQETVYLFNEGIGTIDWKIDTADFPAWLTVLPVDGNGVASGSVSGDINDQVLLLVDRSQAPSDEVSFTHEFLVEASGDSSQGVMVTAHMNVPQIPQIELDADGDPGAEPSYLNFDLKETEQTFVIRNTGNGPLDWSTPAQASLPTWLKSISPSQGTLSPKQQQTITVTVDRATLNYLGGQWPVLVASNDPKNPVRTLVVEVQVDKVNVIGVDPAKIAFGNNQTSAILGVANFGDPEKMLNFKVVPSKDWLAVFPEDGSSEGTLSPNKNWTVISVSVDRSLLEGNGASAVLRVFAKMENSEEEDTSVAAVEVPVTVIAAPLTIEAARPGQRVPSLLRYVLMLRNIQYKAIPLPDAILDDTANQISLYEDDSRIEVSESSQFLVPNRRIRGTALILLDYSGSMAESAAKVTDLDVAGAADPLQALYEKTISELINEFPPNYRVALGIFNERGGSGIRTLRDASAEPTFTKNKNVLLYRLQNADVLDHGATPLFEAFEAGAVTLLSEDGDLIPFDSSDDRILIVVSDGRVTTPPGEITPYILALQTWRVRPFVVGWGLNIGTDPLIRLSVNAGGHYYATRNVKTDDVDEFGNPVRIPQVSELLNWCQTEPLDECDQSISKDLAAQVMFGYVSLNEIAGITVEGRMLFNDPNDQNSPCLLEQKNINGSFKHTQLDMLSYTGDARLGQIGLVTDGISSGIAEVVVRGDYMPRNIGQLSFDIRTVGGDPGMTMTISQVTQIEGGLIHDWVKSGSGTVYTYNTPDQPLRYADFGDMLRIRFENVTQPFDLRFEVLYPQLATHPDSKYFTHPDSIHVDSNRFLASSSPYPNLTGTPALNVANLMDFDTTVSAGEIVITNVGGSHIPTSVGLYWEANVKSGGDFLKLMNVPDDPDDRIIYSVLAPFTLDLEIDRSAEAGIHYGEIELVFNSVFGYEIKRTITVRAEILPPVLTVTPTTLNFNSTTTQLDFTVQNTGQSTLTWSIDGFSFPDWLTVDELAGSFGPGVASTFKVRVDTTAVDPLAPTTSFTVRSIKPIQTKTVNVNVTLP